jgi:hypothetical protein
MLKNSSEIEPPTFRLVPHTPRILKIVRDVEVMITCWEDHKCSRVFARMFESFCRLRRADWYVTVSDVSEAQRCSKISLSIYQSL